MAAISLSHFKYLPLDVPPLDFQPRNLPLLQNDAACCFFYLALQKPSTCTPLRRRQRRKAIISGTAAIKSLLNSLFFPPAILKYKGKRVNSPLHSRLLAVLPSLIKNDTPKKKESLILALKRKAAGAQVKTSSRLIENHFCTGKPVWINSF